MPQRPEVNPSPPRADTAVVVESNPRFLGWLVDSMRSGLVAIDRSGAVAALNPGARRMLGAHGPGFGRSCREVLRDQPTVARLLEGALGGKERPSRAELVLEPVDGQGARTIGFTLDSVRDASGSVQGAALVFRDLTPFERCDEQERLRDRLAALGQMAAGLAHELRNPLTGMEVLAGLLKRRLAGQPEELALLAELTGELRTLSRTVTESLEFVRPVRLSHALADPVELLEESLALARSRVPFAGAIERDFDEELPLVLADAEQLRGVETNLIVNALESMAACARPEGHRLLLGLRVRTVERSTWAVSGDEHGDEKSAAVARELVITVADTGSGVDRALREQVFHPFFSTKQGGSGVGLAHAQKVVASHGGALELDGEPGEGAIFRVRLALPDEGSP
jgi:nitrogen-specific signal transduction histidine kinase